MKTLDGKWATEDFFCLVGTNYKDYPSGNGWIRRAVGEGSDGLVLIENAFMPECRHELVHQSHSGSHGIVNSEEGYRHLVRFLFGEAKIEGLLSINNLPDGGNGGATFDVEVTVTEHDGVAISERTAREWSELPADSQPGDKVTIANVPATQVPIFSLFLPERAVKSLLAQSRPLLRFTVNITVVLRGRKSDGGMRAPEVYREPVYRGEFLVDVSRDDSDKLVTLLMDLDRNWASNLTEAAIETRQKPNSQGVTANIPLKSAKGFSGTFYLRVTPRNDMITPTEPLPTPDVITQGTENESSNTNAYEAPLRQ